MRLPPALWNFLRSRQTRRAVQVVAVLLLLAAAFAYPAINRWGDRRWEGAVATLRERGFPVTLDQAFGTAVPEIHNLFEHPDFRAEMARPHAEGLARFAEMQSLPFHLRISLEGVPMVAQLDPDLARQILAALEPVGPRRQALIDALENCLPFSAVVADPSQRKFPLDVHGGLRLLGFFRDHAIASIAAGDPAAALDDFRAAGQLAKGLRHPRGWSGEESFAAMHFNQAVESSILSMPLADWTDDQLSALDELLAGFDYPAERQTWLRGTPAQAIHLHGEIAAGRRPRFELKAGEILGHWSWKTADLKPQAHRLWRALQPRGLAWIRAADQLVLLADVVDATQAAGPPWDHGLLARVDGDLIHALGPKFDHRFSLNALSQLGHPQAEQMQRRIAAARVRLALERHRLRHGKWPASPGDLDPDLAADLPTDPLAGRPFGFRIDGEGRGVLETAPTTQVGAESWTFPAAP
jgi:hypothetical protein